MNTVWPISQKQHPVPDIRLIPLDHVPYYVSSIIEIWIDFFSFFSFFTVFLFSYIVRCTLMNGHIYISCAKYEMHDIIFIISIFSLYCSILISHFCVQSHQNDTHVGSYVTYLQLLFSSLNMSPDQGWSLIHLNINEWNMTCQLVHHISWKVQNWHSLVCDITVILTTRRILYALIPRYFLNMLDDKHLPLWYALTSQLFSKRDKS